MGVTTPEEPLPAAVEAVRLQLQSPPRAAGRPAPDLRVDPPRKQERAPSVHDGTVVVPPSLLAGGPARQLWDPAARPGRVRSPPPRQRQRLGWLLFGLAGLVYLVLLLVVAPNQPIVWLLIAL